MSAVQNDHRIHTLTETLPQEAAGYVPHQPVQEHVWGPAEKLEPPSTTVQEAPRLSVERERQIRNRLADVLVRGREMKLQALFARIHAANVPPPIKEQLEGWVQNFSVLDLQHGEERSLSLAILVCKVIRPAKLFAMEDAVREILQQMWTNGKLVETFLQENEIGLLLEKLFKDGCARLELVAQTVARAEGLARQQIDAQIELACNRIKEQLRLFQQLRKQVYTCSQDYVTALNQEVERFRVELLKQVDEMERTGIQDANNFKQQAALLAQLETFLRGIV